MNFSQISLVWAVRGRRDGVGRPANSRSPGAESRRLEHVEDENRRLKQLVADQALDVQMLKHLSEGNW